MNKYLHGKERRGRGYGGMYPERILDDEGEQGANPASITKKNEKGQTAHFLDIYGDSSKYAWSVANSSVW